MPEPHRTALVLGAAVRPDGTASPTLALRTDHAVALFRAGKVDRICLTGGRGRHGAPESHVARDMARAAGVPENALLVEDRSVTTFENLAFAQPLVTGAVVLVSNRWHLPRARLIAWLLGMEATGSGPPGRLPARKVAVAVLREAAATPLSIRRAVAWTWRGKG